MNMISTYGEAMDYMYAQLPMFHRQGAAAYRKDLHNTIALLDAIGNPQMHIQCIHVAGTNGKGSVSHMIASVLQEKGMKIGLYTSPHYRIFQERIKINGKYITEEFIIDFLNANRLIIEKINPSFFELTVALAFLYFKKEKIDIAVIETGLGGRLDSTNVIVPLLSVITNISFDHSDLLGDTLDKIATEKAGIIKKNVPVLIGRNQKELMPIFNVKAKQENAMIYYANDLVCFSEKKKLDLHSKLEVQSIDPLLNFSFTPDLKGIYQIENYLTALAATYVLNNKCNFKLSKKAIKNGLENVTKNANIIGRWQKLKTSRPSFAESAHNEDGIQMLLLQIKSLSYTKLHIILGFVKDKNIDKILDLLPKDAKYYFVAAKIPRALDANELMLKAKEKGLQGKSYSSVKSAFNASQRSRTYGDVVIVTGSIFVVAEIV